MAQCANDALVATLSSAGTSGTSLRQAFLLSIRSRRSRTRFHDDATGLHAVRPLAEPMVTGTTVSRLGATLLVVASLTSPAHAASAGLQITVPAADLLVGDRITAAAWPGRVIRTPDEDGQFEVLVRKAALPAGAWSRCRMAGPGLLVGCRDEMLVMALDSDQAQATAELADGQVVQLGSDDVPRVLQEQHQGGGRGGR